MNKPLHGSEKSAPHATRGTARSLTAARRASLIVCAAALALGACADRQRASNDDNDAAPSAAAASAAPTDKPAPIPGATSAADAKTGAAAFDSAALEGAWEGSYHAKKGSVAMPSAVKDAARAADDGKAAAGDGVVSLVIAPDGEIAGKVKGALGEGSVRGKAEGGTIRASIFPDDPSAPSAMRGTLLGFAKESVIQASIRASGPDATVVREAALELKRK